MLLSSFHVKVDYDMTKIQKNFDTDQSQACFIYRNIPKDASNR